MARSFFKLKLQPLDRLKKKFKKSVDHDIEVYIKRRYEEITAPFETNFTFEIVEKEGETLEFHTRPVREDIPRDRENGGEVDSWVLFNTLDLGSDGAARVILPEDFAHESAANSVETSHQAYSRNNIYVDSSQSGPGMEARNWSDLIAEEYKSRGFKNIRNAANFLAKSALGK